MTASADPFDARARAELMAMLVANGVVRPRAQNIVDLACHAAESSVTTLCEICDRAEGLGGRLMARELALQLARARLQAIFERLQELGAQQGCPQYAGQVGLRL